MEEKEELKVPDMPDEAKVDLEGIKRVIAEDKAMREARCIQRIKEVVKEESCNLTLEANLKEIAPGIYRAESTLKIVSQ